MKPWAIFCGADLRYLTLSENEEGVWQEYLGWPTPEEIEEAKKTYRAERVRVHTGVSA